LKMLPEIRYVFEDICKWGRYWAGDKILELSDPHTGKFLAKRSDDPMWARIILRSANAEGGLESATAKAAWLDECGQDGFTLESWQAVLRRLAINQGRALGTTTPYNLGWLKSEIYDQWEAGDRDYDVIQFASTVNPIFPQAEFERAKRTMQDWLFQMFYEGKLARPGHLIYKCFTDAMIVAPFAIPRQWRRIVGVDFGGANQALVWLAEDPKTSQWFLYDESIEGGLSTVDHVRHAQKKLEGITNSSFFRWSRFRGPGKARLVRRRLAYSRTKRFKCGSWNFKSSRAYPVGQAASFQNLQGNPGRNRELQT
jgi:hypothetical protein